MRLGGFGNLLPYQGCWNINIALLTNWLSPIILLPLKINKKI